MRWLRDHRPSPAAAIAMAALIVALGGVAFAAIPDSGGVIHACYQKANGNLRVVDSERGCRSSEHPLSWSQDHGPGGSLGVQRIPQTFLNPNETRVIFDAGPFTLTAACRFDVVEPDISSGPIDVPQVLISTTEAHSAYTDHVRGNTDLNPNTPEEGRRLIVLARITNGGDRLYDSMDLTASAPSGALLTGKLVVGLDVLGHDGQCIYEGHLTGP